MAGMPTNQRDQLMLFVAILGIAGAGAFYQFKYTPKADELTAKVERLERLDASNQRAKALMARGTVEQMQQEAKVLEDNLALMRTLIPAGNEVPALLDQIIAAARRVGLEQDGFLPGAVVQGEAFDTYRYRLSFNGTYHQIGDLLAQIGSLRRIITPVNLLLAPAPDGTSRLRVRADEQILNATFDIQTYVVRTTPGEAGAQ